MRGRFICDQPRDYRADVFGSEKTKAAFFKCLSEACVKPGWVAHAWCVMSNQYHPCFTRPQPNRVEGMRWLQATFSMRFNRPRNERGHVFKGGGTRLCWSSRTQRERSAIQSGTGASASDRNDGGMALD